MGDETAFVWVFFLNQLRWFMQHISCEQIRKKQLKVDPLL